MADYGGYYWIDVVAMAVAPDVIRYQPVYEKPVIPDPIGPVVNPVEAVSNPNYKVTINANSQFAFGGAAFDARGIVTKGVVR